MPFYKLSPNSIQWNQMLMISEYLNLSVTSHINCIVARCLINATYLTACVFMRSWWRCTFEWRRLWRWIITKIENNVIIASFKSETMGKLMINRIPGLRLLTSSLTGSALRTLVESLDKPRDINKRSQSLAWKTWYQKTLTLYSLYPSPVYLR